MIADPQGKDRPVYTTCASDSVSLYLPNGEGAYEFDRTFLNVDDLKREYPDAVRHVWRRDRPNKKRHPDVHYVPARRGAFCRIYFPDSATLTGEQRINAKRTTDVSKVTCPICLKAIAAAIVRTGQPQGANA